MSRNYDIHEVNFNQKIKDVLGDKYAFYVFLRWRFLRRDEQSKYNGKSDARVSRSDYGNGLRRRYRTSSTSRAQASPFHCTRLWLPFDGDG
jgi:hypothetical protein